MRKKFHTLKEAANETPGFGFKTRGDAGMLPDNKIVTEAQAALEITKATKCIVAFVNGTNATDIEICEVSKNKLCFDKIRNNLINFLNDYFVRQLVKKNINVKVF